MKSIMIMALVLTPLLARGADAQQNESFYKIRSARNRRINGVKLVATLSVAKEEDVIELNWSLDYDGPRPPLVMVPPSLRLATNGCTEVVIYAEPEGGQPHEMRLASPTQLGRFWVREEWFLEVKKGETATGLIQVSVAEVRAYFLKHWPERFQAEIVPKLSMQLEHKPTMRGEAYDLDAWTGHLHSSVMPLELDQW